MTLPWRGIAAALAVLVVTTVLLAGLERARGQAALGEAEAARLKRDLPLAIAAARVAAEARVPYTSHADRALRLLETMGEEAVVARDPATAMLALSVARQAAEATQQLDRARALGLRVHSIETAKRSTEVPVDAQTVPPDPAATPARATRPTGVGRGPLSASAQGAMTLGAMAALAALAAVWWATRLRWGVLVLAVGTALLAAARLLP